MFMLPDFIEEAIDPTSDPLAILLAREGAGQEAYIMHRQHMAGAQQIIENALIQQRPDQEDEYTALCQERIRRKRAS